MPEWLQLTAFLLCILQFCQDLAFDAKGNETDTTYDRANRVTEVQQPAVPVNGSGSTRPTTHSSYDADGNVLTITDPNGHVTANNQGYCRRFFTLHTRIVFGDGCDSSCYVAADPSRAILSVNGAVVIGIGWVTTSIGTNFLFEDRSVKLFLITCGYHIVRFLVAGIVLGLLQ